MTSFRLIPFGEDNIANIEITGEINRRDNHLSIRYKINGYIEQILFPTPSRSPSRKGDLWKATCFEFSITIPDQPQYWEFNMSPSGDWNVYVMDQYRRVGFREEKAVTELPFQFTFPNLEATINLTPLFQTIQHLQVSVTAIIQTKDGNETYWALTHPGPQADFHLREGFTVLL